MHWSKSFGTWLILFSWLLCTATEAQPFNWSTTPLTWVGYRYSNGTAIQDPSSDVTNNPSYNLTFDPTYAPFTLQMAATPTTGVFRIQVDGLTQWSVNSYIIFIANAANVQIGRVFLSLSGNSGDIGFNNNSSTVLVVSKGSQATNMGGWARIVQVPNTSNSYIDFQFPLATLYSHLGITASTPIKFYAGTSTGAGNLANINIDWMTTTSNGIPAPADFASLMEASITSISIGALPVELTGFSGRHYDGRTVLHWETASEINSAGFEIQRSVDGNAWKPEGYVPAAGTSYVPRRYEFVDQIEAAGEQLRYRLRQIDRDGTEEFSPVVEVATTAGPEASLQLFPQPAHGQTSVRCSILQPGIVQVKLFDACGRVVRTLLESAAQNAASFSFVFNTEGLRSGRYFIVMHHADGTTVRPFLLVE